MLLLIGEFRKRTNLVSRIALFSFLFPTGLEQLFAHRRSAQLVLVSRPCFFLPLNHPSFPRQQRADFSSA